jgi:hypothetical protein
LFCFGHLALQSISNADFGASTCHGKIVSDAAADGRHVACGKSADQQRYERPQRHVDAGLAGGFGCGFRASAAASVIEKSDEYDDRNWHAE